MGEEPAETFVSGMRAEDRLYLPDPVYQGGTVDRSRGSDWLAETIRKRGGDATHIPSRGDLGSALVSEAANGDRIVIMGARDDTLSEFAAELVTRIGAR
jgi:UDP-N-acetylmuramate--alanine ligase